MNNFVFGDLDPFENFAWNLIKFDDFVFNELHYLFLLLGGNLITTEVRRKLIQLFDFPVLTTI